MSKSPNIVDQFENNNSKYDKDYMHDINILKNDINQYQIKEIIGEGMFGKVKLAFHLLTNEKVAIKIFDKGKIKTKKEKEYIEREINILKKLNHYNTIKLYNIIKNDEFIFVIQEYISGKELLHFIENTENLTEKDICRLYQQIISGIEYMHEMGIAHRDLKLENILLNYKKDIKIIDFGLSNKYDRDMDELLHSSCGSPCYAAPEMIKGMEYHGINTDIWSSGIILYLMLCKQFPFNDTNNSKLYQKILSGKFLIPNYLSNEAKDLINNLLKVNPQERIKINEIKNHPWFNLINKNNNYCKGIDINKTILPIDVSVIKEMTKFGVDKNVLINNILRNNFNNITTTYNLLLQKKIRNGRKSIADFYSNLYLNYINDDRNKFSYFNNDLESIIKSRINNLINKENNLRLLPSINNEYEFNRTFRKKYSKCNYYNFTFGKTNPKISKSDEYTKRQISERQKDKNVLLYYPIKFHTIDHDSYSNSKKKKMIIKKSKNKSPNLCQFNTKRNNNKEIKYNINTIKNNGYILNKYRENIPLLHQYAEAKRSNDLYLSLLNKKSVDKSKNKFNNFPNYKQYLFNKSVDNKLSKEKKNNGVNNSNYINFKNNKFNKIMQIRKKIREPLEIKKNHKTIEEPTSVTPIKTENEKNIYTKRKKEKSFIQEFNNCNLDEKEKKTIINLNKTKISKDKNKINNNVKISNIKNNYIINKNTLINRKSFNDKESSNYGAENNKRNEILYEERENKHKFLSLSQQKDKFKDKKRIKTKKASSLSIDLNIRNQGKNEINIYTNKPKRKNVMKFINKNNNNDANGNFKMNNIFNKYGYCYKNEMKKNNHNKSLDANINYKKLSMY